MIKALPYIVTIGLVAVWFQAMHLATGAQYWQVPGAMVAAAQAIMEEK